MDPQQTETPSPLDEFSFFPEFPKEIRDKIWMLALSASRPTHLFSPHFACKSLAPPAVLNANRESRSLGLKVFSQLDVYGITGFRSFFINTEIDIFCFFSRKFIGRQPSLPQHLNIFERVGAKHIAFEDEIWEGIVRFEYCADELEAFLRRNRQVESITVLTRDYNCVQCVSEMKLVEWKSAKEAGLTLHGSIHIKQFEKVKMQRGPNWKGELRFAKVKCEHIWPRW